MMASQERAICFENFPDGGGGYYDCVDGIEDMLEDCGSDPSTW